LHGRPHVRRSGRWATGRDSLLVHAESVGLHVHNRAALVSRSAGAAVTSSGGVVAITGSAGGIGAATRARLEKDGCRVIGIDVRDAEVVADLSTTAGRAAMVEAVTRASDGRLDGLVAAAGVMGEDPIVVSINYYGAVATLDGLRPLLARGENPSAIAISSNSTTTTPGLPIALVETLLSSS